MAAVSPRSTACVCPTAPAEQRFQSSVPGGIKIVTTVEGRRMTGCYSCEMKCNEICLLCKIKTMPKGIKPRD